MRYRLKSDRYREFVEQLAEWAAFAEWDVRYDYSGRCMYGRTCFGVVVPSISDLFQFYYQLGYAMAEVEEFASLPESYSQDSMGRDTIVYWSCIATEPGEPSPYTKLAQLEC